MTMSYDQVVIHLRSQLKQLAAAAAAQCLQDRLERNACEHPLIEYDRLARQIAAPALEALSTITGELQAWPEGLEASPKQGRAASGLHSQTTQQPAAHRAPVIFAADGNTPPAAKDKQTWQTKQH